MQGQGNSTVVKESLLAVCLNYDIRVASNKQRRYYHADINAGCGRNHRAGCVGTPPVFARAVARAACDHVAWFVDSNKALIKEAEHRVGEHPCLFNGPRRYFLAMDNAEFLAGLPSRVAEHEAARYARGCILADPNGICRKRGGFPLEAIGRAAAELPRFIVLLLWHHSAGCRTGGYADKYPDKPMSTLTLEQILSTIQRQHWLISGPFGNPSKAVLCGSHYRIPEWSTPPGLHWLDSEMGRHLRQQLSGCPSRELV